MINFINNYSKKKQNHEDICSMKTFLATFNISNSKTEKAKETKEEKRIFKENLTGYSDIVCEFALCTFNLLDRVVNFSWLFI